MAEGAPLNEKVEAVLDEEVTPAPNALEAEGAGELQIVQIVKVENISFTQIEVSCHLPWRQQPQPA